MGYSIDCQRHYLILLERPERWRLRYVSAAAPVLVMLVFCLLVRAQSGSKTVKLAEHDVSQIMDLYRSDNPVARVAILRKKMPPPVNDAAFRLRVHRQLPAPTRTHRVDHPHVVESLRTVLEPVLSLYNRSHAYDIILIRHHVPLMMSDSGVVLVISTGMI